MPLVKEVIYNDTNTNAYTQIIIRLQMLDSRAYTAIQIGIPARETPLDSENLNALTLCEVEVYGGKRNINAVAKFVMPYLRIKRMR